MNISQCRKVKLAVKYINHSDSKNIVTQHDFFVAHDIVYKMLIALDNYLQ